MEVAPFFVDFHHFWSIFTIFYRFSRFTHFCRYLHFVAIYALFPQFFFGQNSLLCNITRFLHVWVSRGHYLLVLGGTGSVLGGTDQYLIVLGQQRAAMVVTWWYCISIGWYWSVLGDTGSKQGGISCQCVICFQKIFYLHGLDHQIIEHLVSRGWYWLVLGVTGSEQGGTGCQHDELSENIQFAWSKPSNH